MLGIKYSVSQTKDFLVSAFEGILICMVEHVRTTRNLQLRIFLVAKFPGFVMVTVNS